MNVHLPHAAFGLVSRIQNLELIRAISLCNRRLCAIHHHTQHKWNAKRDGQHAGRTDHQVRVVERVSTAHRIVRHQVGGLVIHLEAVKECKYFVRDGGIGEENQKETNSDELLLELSLFRFVMVLCSRSV